ncbi:MAG: TonB-dependent receptor, partial [Gammaproteobacteria bacterium]|nr:TonB-dependent receptor [Gammaproteobacteria bacterium]
MLSFERATLLVSAALVAALAAFAGSSVAQETTPAAGPLEEVVVVGTRRRDRSAADSPVPVDVVSGDDFLAHGGSDMDDLLAATVPSYNVSQEPISDAATFIRPATLRSLAPDATLVLVNGKRRHRAAVIALLGAGISGGSQGPDLSSIPAIALDRLEVLRDGASAQYGSDAIAGVMNFVLKSDAEGSMFDLKYGTYFEGDGNSITFAANKGFALTDAGFANISFEWREQDPTSRSHQRPDAQGLIDAGNTHVRTPAAQIWGQPEVSGDHQLFGNFGIDLGNGSEAYAFGNWAERQVEGGFYYRNPHTRGGVFRGPMVDPATGFTEQQGGDAHHHSVPSVKVADLTGNWTPESTTCPAGVPIVGNVPDAAIMAAVQSSPNCYTLYERFPGGFTPQFGGFISDYALAGGVRGELDSGWYYDLSATAGRSWASFYIYNTINPQFLSQRNDIDTHFNAGAYTETDRVINFDMSRPFDTGGYAPINIAWGLEYRDETFRITNGEPNSFFIDPNLESGLAAQGFGVGSNGFPGFQPGDAGDNTVSAFAAYFDVETDLSDTVLVNGAVRYENYDEFGDTFDGKVASRLQLADNFALRASASTGFRVPTAGQANLRNVTTEFNMGRLADIATLPPTNPVAIQKGAQPLTPETSTNLTLGAVFGLGPADITLDYYNIEINDRVAFTSRFNLTEADVTALLAAGVSDATSFTSVRFFTNQQDVKASGVDVVATVPFDVGDGVTNLQLAANFSSIELTRFNPDFTGESRRLQIEEGRPGSRITATLNHSQDTWRVMGRLRHYGEYYDDPTNSGGLPPAGNAFYPGAATLFDFEAAFDVTDRLSVLVGLSNAFDTYPDINPTGQNGEVAGW